MNTDQDEQRKLREMIDKITVAMLTTTAEDGTLHARPMAPIDTEFDGNLWFFARSSSGKTDDIRHDQHVGVSFADPSRQNYVSISGHARLVRDRALIDKFWSESVATWFPKGQDDPDISLIDVAVESAEYWDAPSSTMLYAYGWAKAKLTGEPPHPGGHGKVEKPR